MCYLFQGMFNPISHGGGPFRAPSGFSKFSQEVIIKWPSNFATFSFYLLDVLWQNFMKIRGHLHVVLGVLLGAPHGKKSVFFSIKVGCYIMVDKCWLNKANNMKLCQKLVLYISNIILESQVIILMGKSDTVTSGGKQWRHLL